MNEFQQRIKETDRRFKEEAEKINLAFAGFVEKADMPQEADPVTSCDICGKGLFDGDYAKAITTGDISAVDDGFMSHETPWLTVACRYCGEKITEAIEKLMDEEGKK